MSKEHGVEPAVGDEIEFNDAGAFTTIRGVKLNGKIVYLRSDEELEERERLARADREVKQKEAFESQKDDLDVAYDQLPVGFQKRIDRLRAKCTDFRWKFEAYDMFVCVEATKIVDALKTPEAIKAFHELKTIDEQKKMVGNLDYDEHSGNTFGAAVQMAYMYAVNPSSVKYMHGALAALVGCEGYGCHPLTKEESDDVAKMNLG